MTIAIRPLETADIPDLARIHAEGWRTAYAHIMSREKLDSMTPESQAAFFTRWMSNTEAPPSGWVAEENGRVVGFTLAGVNTDGLPGSNGEIYKLFVENGHQGQQTGTRLLQPALKFLAEQGFENTVIWAFEQARSVEYYHKLGGEVLLHETYEDDYGNCLPVLVFTWKTVDLLRRVTDRLDGRRGIEIYPYHVDWALRYRVEAALLAPLFGANLVAMYHVGSTAVPGLCAKPTLDILVAVKSIEGVDALNESFCAAGFEPRGENGMPGRLYFVRRCGAEHRVHVHVFQADSPEIERHVRFRDYLRAHPETAQEYARLKIELAERFRYDSVAYTNGKDAFISAIDEREELTAKAQRAQRRKENQ